MLLHCSSVVHDVLTQVTYVPIVLKQKVSFETFTFTCLYFLFLFLIFFVTIYSKKQYCERWTAMGQLNRA